jgi:hypothetical protein
MRFYFVGGPGDVKVQAERQEAILRERRQIRAREAAAQQARTARVRARRDKATALFCSPGWSRWKQLKIAWLER